MRLETFRGTDLQSVYAMARASLGDDVMVLRTTTVRFGQVRALEIVATTSVEVERVRRRLQVAPPILPSRSGGRGDSGPLIVALVGPTGAGKTTTIAKLAVSPEAFGARRVGLLALDTYRVGALEQIQTYAEIAELPLEIIYDIREIGPALKRLNKCDVILVDTPGRSPKIRRPSDEWQDLLRVISPDEVHLVLPATLRTDIALAQRGIFAQNKTTHLLLTKLDEVPNECGVADLALRMDLPTRWVTDGQDVPDDLKSAAARLIGSLGLVVTEPQSNVLATV
ncbi:MAG: hypothetical protein M3081_02475, partial [Gemmatimonadota bacterium]|nr:hypothetical protein [Gemmatimonadota bacterium]